MTSMFDKAKDAASEHSDQADSAIQKGGDAIDQKTGGEHSQQIDQVQDKAQDAVNQNQAPGDSS